VTAKSDPTQRLIKPPEVNRRLQAIGQLDLLIESRQNEMIARIEAIKAEYEPELKEMRVRRERLEASLSVLHGNAAHDMSTVNGSRIAPDAPRAPRGLQTYLERVRAPHGL
jgi:phage host-nuclease inhibitor protein Gam